MASKLLTALEVANYLDVSISLVYAWVASGQIKSICLPHARESKATKQNRHSIRLRLEDVEEFIHAYTREQVCVGKE